MRVRDSIAKPNITLSHRLLIILSSLNKAFVSFYHYEISQIYCRFPCQPSFEIIQLYSRPVISQQVSKVFIWVPSRNELLLLKYVVLKRGRVKIMMIMFLFPLPSNFNST